MLRLKVDYEIIQAVDGEYLPDHDMKRYRNASLDKGRRKRYLMNSEIGCALSHLRVFAKMLDENIGTACILEDDAVLGRNFPDIIESEAIARLDWDLLMLGHSSKYRGCPVGGCECENRSIHLCGDYSLGIPIEPPKGTYAYLVRKYAAREFLNHAYPIRMAADNLIANTTRLGLNIFVLTPPQVTHSHDLFPSTIYRGELEFCTPLGRHLQDIKIHLKQWNPNMALKWRILRQRLSRAIRTPYLSLLRHGVLTNSYRSNLGYSLMRKTQDANGHEPEAFPVNVARRSNCDCDQADYGIRSHVGSVDRSISVLLLCDRRYWDHKMARVRFHSMEAIERHPYIRARKDGPGWPGFTDVPTSIERHRPDAVFWYKPLDMKGFDGAECLKVISYNEMYDREWTTHEIVHSASDVVICHHQNDLRNYEKLLSAPRFYHCQHCSDIRYFFDPGLPKQYDVLLVGALNPLVYPLRQKMSRVLRGRLLKGLKVTVLPHPGDPVNDADAQVRRYAFSLSSAKIVLTCSSKYKYALAKYTEVPACGSLLAADIPDDRAEFFREYVLEIEDCDTEQDIAEKLRVWCKDDRSREELTAKGRDLVLASYTQDHYAERFYRIVRENL